MWSEQEPPGSQPAAFVTARLGAAGCGDRVLARADAAVRPADVVLARGDAGLELRRVGAVRPDAVELLAPDPSAHRSGRGEWMARETGAVLGTLLLRWEIAPGGDR